MIIIYQFTTSDIVKKESNEQIRLISWLYLLMACAFAFPSLYFFTAQVETK